MALVCLFEDRFGFGNVACRLCPLSAATPVCPVPAPY